MGAELESPVVSHREEEEKAKEELYARGLVSGYVFLPPRVEKKKSEA